MRTAEIQAGCGKPRFPDSNASTRAALLALTILLVARGPDVGRAAEGNAANPDQRILLVTILRNGKTADHVHVRLFAKDGNVTSGAVDTDGGVSFCLSGPGRYSLRLKTVSGIGVDWPDREISAAELKAGKVTWEIPEPKVEAILKFTVPPGLPGGLPFVAVCRTTRSVTQGTRRMPRLPETVYSPAFGYRHELLHIRVPVMDGKARLAGLRKAEYSVSMPLSRKGGEKYTLVGPTVFSHQPGTPRELTYRIVSTDRARGTLAITVVDDAEGPLPAMPVRLRTYKGKEVAAAKTDGDGVVRFGGLRYDGYTAALDSKTWVLAPNWLNVPHRAEVTLRARRCWDLKVQVVDTRGRPAKVSVRLLDGNPPMGLVKLKAGETDKAGERVLERVPKGLYVVTAASADGKQSVAQAIRVDSAKAIRMRLRETTSKTITVKGVNGKCRLLFLSPESNGHVDLILKEEDAKAPVEVRAPRGSYRCYCELTPGSYRLVDTVQFGKADSPVLAVSPKDLRSSKAIFQVQLILSVIAEAKKARQ